ncbi:MAG: cobyric acid synthase CobQ, partial [Rhodospirillales bacterium]|nr:cobyric acid synthase CobQ [Rhodospirillales bacterium]
FAADSFRHAFLSSLRTGRSHETAHDLRVEKTLDALAEHLEKHLDLNHLYDCARPVS